MKEEISDWCDALKETLIRKNENYGNAAAKPPIFAPLITPRDALLVRISDKISRIETLLKGEPDKVGESLADTFFDLAGYTILFLIENEKEGRDDLE